ncbi:peptidase C15 [Mesorhizobium sp. L-8-10]|uniref:pyroglutamyl-peptidase I n=1 Tax=Mesorhizobium sp. L-8-10 TaxID=2744523 RepID=UPI0019252674|nr:pyroglutamyl-peptidase I [Mesorhizobium sp. L-8-10]BCH33731.1 peptidase C15 [Mesorhizobium sp. L-8-10]
MTSAGPERPRILVTGFSAFPGAPVNPTERLVAELRNRLPELASVGAVAAVVLDVDYAKLPEALRRLAAAQQPDIAIHFGLSAAATGFVLERLARNAYGGKPDNSGHVPEAARICDGDDVLASTLPLDALHVALAAAGIPVDWSDDAGGYLCNYLFYLSRSPVLDEFAPGMSGFIHVPPLREGETTEVAGAMDLETLVEGALLVIRLCAEAWGAQRTGTTA